MTIGWRDGLRHCYNERNCSKLRLVVALFCLVQGVGRLLLSAAPAQPVNFIPSDWYGVLMTVAGVLLLATLEPRWRRSVAGRAVAILTCALWLLLTFDLLPAWISAGNAGIIALLAANEVRAR